MYVWLSVVGHVSLAFATSVLIIMRGSLVKFIFYGYSA